MARFKRCTRRARGPEQLGKVGRCDLVAAVALPLQDPGKLAHISRRAKGGERHHLVLIRGVLEAEIVRDAFVQEAERMRQVYLPDAAEFPTSIMAIGGSGLLATSIHGEHRGLVERGGEERARLVRQVMLDEMPAVRSVMARSVEAPAQVIGR